MKKSKIFVVIASVIGVILGFLGIAVVLDMLLLNEDVDEDSFEDEDDEEIEKEREIDLPLKRHYIEIPMSQRENR